MEQQRRTDTRGPPKGTLTSIELARWVAVRWRSNYRGDRTSYGIVQSAVIIIITGHWRGFWRDDWSGLQPAPLSPDTISLNILPHLPKVARFLWVCQRAITSILNTRNYNCCAWSKSLSTKVALKAVITLQLIIPCFTDVINSTLLQMSYIPQEQGCPITSVARSELISPYFSNICHVIFSKIPLEPTWRDCICK